MTWSTFTEFGIRLRTRAWPNIANAGHAFALHVTAKEAALPFRRIDALQYAIKIVQWCSHLVLYSIDI